MLTTRTDLFGRTLHEPVTGRQREFTFAPDGESELDRLERAFRASQTPDDPNTGTLFPEEPARDTVNPE